MKIFKTLLNIKKDLDWAVKHLNYRDNEIRHDLNITRRNLDNLSKSYNDKIRSLEREVEIIKYDAKFPPQLKVGKRYELNVSQGSRINSTKYTATVTDIITMPNLLKRTYDLLTSEGEEIGIDERDISAFKMIKPW